MLQNNVLRQYWKDILKKIHFCLLAVYCFYVLASSRCTTVSIFFSRSLTKVAMVRYAAQPLNPGKSCKSRGSNLRVHFKNTRETAQAIKGLHLRKATQYLKDVINHKRCVPFRRFNRGCGRTAQAKEFNTTQVGFEIF